MTAVHERCFAHPQPALRGPVRVRGFDVTAGKHNRPPGPAEPPEWPTILASFSRADEGPAGQCDYFFLFFAAGVFADLAGALLAAEPLTCFWPCALDLDLGDLSPMDVLYGLFQGSPRARRGEGFAAEVTCRNRTARVEISYENFSLWRKFFQVPAGVPGGPFSIPQASR